MDTYISIYKSDAIGSRTAQVQKTRITANFVVRQNFSEWDFIILLIALCINWYIFPSRCESTETCIPSKWICDDYEDCPDASDELDCFEEQSTTAQIQRAQYSHQLPYSAYSIISAKDRTTPSNSDRFTVGTPTRIGLASEVVKVLTRIGTSLEQKNCT